VNRQGALEGCPSLTASFSIEPTGVPGRYRAEIPPGWAAPFLPSGGLVSGVALRAMAMELATPVHRLRSSTTVFVSKVAEGPVLIDVEVLRRGRRMSQVRASIRNEGSDEAGHHLIAAFGEHREGYRLDMRRVRMFMSWEEGWEGGEAEAIRWVRFRRPESDMGRGIEAFDMLVLADTMPPALGQYLGPGHRLFHAPSVDLSFHCFARSRSDWILSRARMRWADDGYASAEIHLWDESRQLIAYATQMMLLRFPDASEIA
jgi:acyl-CoA thioesterase